MWRASTVLSATAIAFIAIQDAGGTSIYEMMDYSKTSFRFAKNLTTFD